MELSQPVKNMFAPSVGYTVISRLTPDNQSQVAAILEAFSHKFPGVIERVPAAALHVTLLPLIAIRSDYKGADKDQLYNDNKDQFHDALARIMSEATPFSIRFTSLRVDESAIILISKDSKNFDSLRSKITASITLPPGSRPAPNIVHTTVARFKEACTLEPMREYAASLTIDLPQPVSEFTLVRCNKGLVVDFEVVEAFALGHVSTEAAV